MYFVIFGWNHPETTSYGPVEQQECENCHNTDFWHLKKVSKYFTLFFIPVIPQEHKYWYHCPICNHGIDLDEVDFHNYKSIAKINSDYLENSISNEERIKRIEEFHKSIEQKKEDKKNKIIEESKNWVKLAAEKTNDELLSIIKEKRDDYNPSFLIAAESEAKKRNITDK